MFKIGDVVKIREDITHIDEIYLHKGEMGEIVDIFPTINKYFIRIGGEVLLLEFSDGAISIRENRIENIENLLND